ncbi:class I SAM-dependent methyltransferase [Sciscionella sediminilitoris]|uniref:class I SAM-dependent methyltransferase n=1 Tax=Sciscionella sediminilitoris TaxID=1445613 RepID=UPI0004DF1153|nr:methyltransferase domain-containing protein [Sciscionella sp. SE31]
MSHIPFDGIVEHYDEDRFHYEVAHRLVEGTPHTPGMDVLDIATGTGHAAFAAVSTVDPRRVLAIDFSPAMIEAARRKAGTLDPAGIIEWRVGDAARTPVEDASADLLLCASSLHFLGRRALDDWGRVLRPGGFLAFSLPTAETFRASATFAALMPGGIELPSDAEQAIEPLAAAGFREPTASRFELVTDRPRAAYLVHARVPG